MPGAQPVSNPTSNPPSKGEKFEVEELEAAVDDLSWTERDDDHDLDRHPGFWGKYLKKNPSPQFLADVAKMNATDLDPAQVKRIERKVDLLIIPALAICYMVCRPRCCILLVLM